MSWFMRLNDGLLRYTKHVICLRFYMRNVVVTHSDFKLRLILLTLHPMPIKVRIMFHTLATLLEHSNLRFIIKGKGQVDSHFTRSTPFGPWNYLLSPKPHFFVKIKGLNPRLILPNKQGLFFWATASDLHQTDYLETHLAGSFLRTQAIICSLHLLCVDAQ